jgi:hypothetical protein
MEIALRVVSVIAGTSLVFAAVASAVKTVVIPRQASSIITRGVFSALHRVYDLVTPASMSYQRRDRVLATFAPLGMLGLLVTWISLTFLGYAGIFWGLDGGTSVTVALELSGSSLFTLDHVLADDGLVHRGCVRLVPAGAVDHLPAHDQLGVLTTGARGHRARGASW